MDSAQPVEDVRFVDEQGIQRMEYLAVKLICEISKKMKDRAKQEEMPYEFYYTNIDKIDNLLEKQDWMKALEMTFYTSQFFVIFQETHQAKLDNLKSKLIQQFAQLYQVFSLNKHWKIAAFIQSFLLQLNPQDWLSYLALGRSHLEIVFEQTNNSIQKKPSESTLHFLMALYFINQAHQKVNQSYNYHTQFVRSFLLTYLGNTNTIDYLYKTEKQYGDIVKILQNSKTCECRQNLNNQMKVVVGSFDWEYKCCQNEQMQMNQGQEIEQCYGFEEFKCIVADLLATNTQLSRVNASVAELCHLFFTKSLSQSNSSLLLNIGNKYCQKYQDENKHNACEINADFYYNFVAQAGKSITIDYNNQPKKTKKEIGKKIDKFHKGVQCPSCQSASRQYLLELQYAFDHELSTCLCQNKWFMSSKLLSDDNSLNYLAFNTLVNKMIVCIHDSKVNFGISLDDQNGFEICDFKSPTRKKNREKSQNRNAFNSVNLCNVKPPKVQEAQIAQIEQEKQDPEQEKQILSEKQVDQQDGCQNVKNKSEREESQLQNFVDKYIGSLKAAKGQSGNNNEFTIHIKDGMLSYESMKEIMIKMSMDNDTLRSKLDHVTKELNEKDQLIENFWKEIDEKEASATKQANIIKDLNKKIKRLQCQLSEQSQKQAQERDQMDSQVQLMKKKMTESQSQQKQSNTDTTQFSQNALQFLLKNMSQEILASSKETYNEIGKQFKQFIISDTNHLIKKILTGQAQNLNGVTPFSVFVQFENQINTIVNLLHKIDQIENNDQSNQVNSKLNQVQQKYCKLITNTLYRKNDDKKLIDNGHQFEDLTQIKQQAQQKYLQEQKECIICHVEFAKNEEELRNKRIYEINQQIQQNKNQNEINNSVAGASPSRQSQRRQNKSKNRQAFRRSILKHPSSEQPQELSTKDLQESKLREYVQDNMRYKLSCGHDYYHKKCIMDWLKINPRCPVCNMEVNDQSIKN